MKTTRRTRAVPVGRAVEPAVGGRSGRLAGQGHGRGQGQGQGEECEDGTGDLGAGIVIMGAPPRDPGLRRAL
ncbi:MAG: hypothetical protein MZV64_49990 [Ignavibacteriales bacterium]|nr:hypothetical protein [Ignavibacteriales bacterium]